MVKKIILVFIIILSWWLQNPLAVFSLTLTERINNYPQWNSKISLPSADRDLIFPQWFVGNWQVSSILKEQIAPLAPFTTPGFEQNNIYIDQVIDFPVRYISTIELPKKDNFVPSVINKKKVVIADRAFNGLSITKAYMGIENVQNVVSNPHNSTEQITNFRKDNQLISTVIGRQQETISTSDFVTSEFTRQFFRRPDSVYLNFVESITQYHLVNPNLIEGKQFVAIYLSPEDPDYFKALDKPVALYNYVLNLEKIDN